MTTAPAPTGPVRWSEMAWPDIRALLDKNPSEVGLLPVGAIEQHGPHLPTATDTILARAICDAVSAVTGAPVLPEVAIGCSYGHGAELPGTLSLSPEQLSATVRQVVEWAAISGLKKVLVVNGHFGNQASLLTATDHLRLARPDVQVGATGWWSASAELRDETFVDGEDIHANRLETSLMLAVAPELVHLERISSADDPDRTTNLVFRYTATQLSTNGVTGRPSQASRKLGERLLAVAVEAVADMVRRGRTERPPLVALGAARRPTSGSSN